jgi:hypothetical protein
MKPMLEIIINKLKERDGVCEPTPELCKDLVNDAKGAMYKDMIQIMKGILDDLLKQLEGSKEIDDTYNIDGDLGSQPGIEQLRGYMKELNSKFNDWKQIIEHPPAAPAADWLLVCSATRDARATTAPYWSSVSLDFVSCTR